MRTRLDEQQRECGDEGDRNNGQAHSASRAAAQFSEQVDQSMASGAMMIASYPRQDIAP